MVITISICQRRYGRTGTLAEVGMVTRRSDNPVVPTQVFEADVQGLSAALTGGGSAFKGSAPAALACVLGVQDQEWSMFFVEGKRCAA